MMKDLKIIFGAFILLIFSQASALVTDGTLDASFNGGGLSAFLEVDSQFKAIAVQSDNKIVAVGSAEFNGKKTFAVARYNSDGTFDESFGAHGKVITRFGANDTLSAAHAVVIQDDGKIVAAGFTNAVKNSVRWCLARYNTDGSLDTSFFSGRAIIPGTVITFFGGDDSSQANALVIDAQGKIVVAGTSHRAPDKTYFAVARYTSNGSLDTSFNPDAQGGAAGTVRTTFGGLIDDDQAYAVAIQADKKIVVAGSSMLSGVKTFALARYNPNGSLDRSFFNPKFARVNGTVITNFAYGETEGIAKALVIQPDGKIIAAGFSNSNSWRKDVTRFALARYDGRGILDESFGGCGLSTVPGTVISSFGQHEGASRANALVLQSDGKVVAGGFVSLNGKSHFALARYNYDGKIDPEFNDGYSPAGKVVTTIGGRKANEVFGLAIQHNGDLIAAGSTDMHGITQGLLARYVTNDILLEPAITYPLNEARIINGSAIELHGVAQNPAILKIYVNDELIGSIGVKGKENTWAYTLAPLASGNYRLHVVCQYQGGNVSLASEPVAIIVDQHPKAVNATVITCGINPVSGTLKAIGASGYYTFSVLSSTNGAVSLSGADFVFTPTIASGTGAFEFEVTDVSTNCTGRGIITVNINEIPAVHSSQWDTCQSNGCAGDLSQTVRGGIPPFTFKLHNESHNGAVQLNENGSFNFIPDPEFHGVTQFQYYVIDAKGCISEPQTAYVTVYELPRVVDASFTTHELEAITENLLPFVSGATPPYRFTLVECPNSAAITLEECGTFKLIPMRGFSGVAYCQFKVTDIHNAQSATANIIVTVYEVPVAHDASLTMCENGVLENSLNRGVNKGTAPYIFEQVGSASHGAVQIHSDGSYNFTPDENFSGIASFQYRVSDAHLGISNEATITIQVNELPKVGGDAVTTCQDVVAEGNLLYLVSGGTPPYSFELVNQASHADVTLNVDGSYRIVPEYAFNGVTSFHYRVVDSVGSASHAGSITVTVHETPVAQPTYYETSATHAVVSNLSSLVTNGTPPYTFILESADHGSVELNADGSFTYTPESDFNGLAGFTYHVIDAYLCKSNHARVTIFIHPAPTVSDVSYTIFEGAAITASVQSLAHGGIPPYVFEQIGQTHNGTLTCNTDGSFHFNPSVLSGNGIFTYRITDSQGTISNTATVTIDILELPKLNSIELETVAHKAITFSLANAAFSGKPPYTFSSVGDAIYGTVSLNADGTGVFEPQADFVGTARFEFMVTDAHNGASALATAHIVIHPPLQITKEIVLEVNEDSRVQADFSSAISGSVAPYQFALITEPRNGTVTIDDAGHFTYTPSEGVSGTDTFNYEVNDGLKLSRIAATVHITIHAKPKIKNSEFVTNENKLVHGSLHNFVSEGLAPYTFEQVDATSNGSVAVNSDGSFIFTPDHGFFGIADFKYAVTDARNLTSKTGIITVRVYELPRVQDLAVTTVAKKPVSGNLQSLVSLGQPPYTFIDAAHTVNGTLVLTADGNYTFQPNSDFVGLARFDYEVSDVHHGIAKATVVVTVKDALVVTNPISLTTCQGSAVQGDIKPFVSGGIPPYEFTAINTDAFTADSDGVFVYHAPQSFNGLASFDVEVVDAMSNTIPATVEISVYDAPQVHDKTIVLCEYCVLKGQLNDLVNGGKPEYVYEHVGTATNGVAKINADGSYTFIPTPGYLDAHFSYQITDANACVSNTATVTIHINKSPSANVSTFVAEQNTPYSGNLAALITGGSEPYSFNVSGSSSHGDVTIAPDGSFIFTPESDFTGTASFQYNATDANNCTSNIATITMIINPVNRFYPNHLIKRYLPVGAR